MPSPAARRNARRWTLPVVAVVAFAALPWGAAEAQVTLPIGEEGSEGSDSAGLVAMSVRVHGAWEDLSPGEEPEPLRVEVANDGLVPIAISLAHTGLSDPASGARIEADRLWWTASYDGPALPAGGQPVPDVEVPPGAATSFWLHLLVPTGNEQWVPAGSYHATVSVAGKEVSA